MSLLKKICIYQNRAHFLIWSRSFVSNFKQQLDFSDGKEIYKFKTTKELLRGYGILRICAFNLFVDNALTVSGAQFFSLNAKIYRAVLKAMKAGQRLLGERIFNGLARPTFYNQFVGGDKEAELIQTAKILERSNIRLMVCPVQEEDVGEAEGTTEYERCPEIV